MPYTHDELKAFLIRAKLATYAAQDNQASVPPVLPGSHQLEYREGSFRYRDVYFGMAYFAGQEVVYYEDQPIWTMTYAGGVSDAAQAGEIYGFLQGALRQIQPDRLYRGPAHWSGETYTYTDTNQGDINNFWGSETISQQGQVLYQLHYSGGFIR